MDVVERLTLEAAARKTTLAAAHVQRYELAARLCHGRRVADVCCGSGYGAAILAERATAVLAIDIDAATIDLADLVVGKDPKISFRAMDAVEFLASHEAESYGAIVMFEGLEHVENPSEALDALRSHAEVGRRIIVSVPNSLAFAERNPFHRTDFGYSSAREVFGSFPDCTILPQFLAEGALVLGSSEDVAQLTLLDHAEPEYANTFVACINVPATELTESVARMYFAVSPVHSRYMLSLERANRDLWRTNGELARSLLRDGGRASKVESAAAGLLGRLSATQARAAELERQLRLAEELRSEAEEELARLRSIAGEMHETIAARDAEIAARTAELERVSRELQQEVWNRQQVIDSMERTRIWRLARRYWSVKHRLKRAFRTDG